MQIHKITKPIAAVYILTVSLILGGCGQQKAAGPPMGPPEVTVLTVKAQQGLISLNLARLINQVTLYRVLGGGGA